MASAKYKRGKDGYFQARLWDGTYNNDGTKHRKVIRTKKSSAELERMAREFQKNVTDRKTIKRTEATFGQYADTWLETYKAQAEMNTKKMYQLVFDAHFRPIWDVPLADIDRIHMQIVLNNAEGKKRTQQIIQMTFKEILRSAVLDHIYPANVANDVIATSPPIKYRPKEKRPLTEYEKKAVFNATYKHESDRAFVYILYGCGLRRQEALALTRFDIKDNMIEINKAHVFDAAGRVVIKGPKSRNGYRSVPIPDVIRPTIKSYVKNCTGPYLFHLTSGEPLTKNGYRRMWGRIISAMQEVSEEDITGLTAHIFRHNYCTNLCYQIPTISIKKIAQLIGDTEKMVLDVYNHIILEKENASDAVNAAMTI